MKKTVQITMDIDTEKYQIGDSANEVIDICKSIFNGNEVPPEIINITCDNDVRVVFFEGYNLLEEVEDEIVLQNDL